MTEKKVLHVNNIKLPVYHSMDDLLRAVAREGVTAEPSGLRILRKSVDARNKADIRFVYSLAVDKAVSVKKLGKNASYDKEVTYTMPEHGSSELTHSPLIVGAGPAGLFAGLLLARAGYEPVIIERGADVDTRTRDVEAFWKGGALDTESNVSFGEGGAGTFSDGKLTTGVKDRDGRIRYVLEAFVRGGADPSIAYWYKPHVGSDVLKKVIRSLREEIIAAGGRILFRTRLDSLITDGGAVTGVRVSREGQTETIETGAVILAIGHSARDTFRMLYETGADMQAKAFAVGFRVEHPQDMIQQAMYGTTDRTYLPAADYKTTAKAGDRGVYSFCMCPGGYVVNASSEEGGLAVNGMSYAGRDGLNANSAIVTTVTPDDYGADGPLAGIAFQRELERAAYVSGCGKIPVQLYGDYKRGVRSTALGDIVPQTRGGWELADLTGVLPGQLYRPFVEGMETFGRQIDGFNREDALLSGVESRTSSPVRIVRDGRFESNIRGLFPCGEGAGYAGGIMSAAMDGMKVAEEIIRRYRPWTKKI